MDTQQQVLLYSVNNKLGVMQLSINWKTLSWSKLVEYVTNCKNIDSDSQ